MGLLESIDLAKGYEIIIQEVIQLIKPLYKLVLCLQSVERLQDKYNPFLLFSCLELGLMLPFGLKLWHPTHINLHTYLQAFGLF